MECINGELSVKNKMYVWVSTILSVAGGLFAIVHTLLFCFILNNPHEKPNPGTSALFLTSLLFVTYSIICSGKLITISFLYESQLVEKKRLAENQSISLFLSVILIVFQVLF